MNGLLNRVARDYATWGPSSGLDNWSRRAPGESLYAVLHSMGIDTKQLLCTPDDPWALETMHQVEDWIRRRVLSDEAGDILRVDVLCC